ncbi:MAG: hypothetical protein IKV34_03445, partial [Clostridia bacterium]|nr:hypothetical protein [Clostridia bacterium]
CGRFYQILFKIIFSIIGIKRNNFYKKCAIFAQNHKKIVKICPFLIKTSIDTGGLKQYNLVIIIISVFLAL